jgi:protein tyrosine phosphatase
MVEIYLDIIRNNPNAWLHVHCHVGKGRTTTFMALYDMFHNARNLEFIEILDRQKEIDGQDFMKHRTKSNLDARKHTLFEERISFLENFYRYCRESDPQTVSWQDWLQQP